MNELHPDAILAAVVAGVLAGFSAFGLFFRASKARIYERIAKVEDALNEMDERHQQHHAQLIELKANQINTCERLAELKLIHKEAVNKLEDSIEKSSISITRQLGDLMRELRTKT